MLEKAFVITLEILYLKKWSGFVIESAGPHKPLIIWMRLASQPRMKRKRNSMQSSMQHLQKGPCIKRLQTSWKAWEIQLCNVNKPWIRIPNSKILRLECCVAPSVARGKIHPFTLKVTNNQQIKETVIIVEWSYLKWEDGGHNNLIHNPHISKFLANVHLDCFSTEANAT